LFEQILSRDDKMNFSVLLYVYLLNANEILLNRSKIDEK